MQRVDLFPTHEFGGYKLRAGRPYPFGATVVGNAVNFSIYSRYATDCTLVLFHNHDKTPFLEIPFFKEFRLGNVFSMMVFDLDYENIEYGYRMDGPFDPRQGHRFDKTKILMDPYAKLIAGRDVWGKEPDWINNYQYRSRVVFDDFDWENDLPLETPVNDLVIYEMHVRNFTCGGKSGVKHPGTFAGIAEKIPYLKELGVNCVELMPIHEFDEFENSRPAPDGHTLYNAWGYSNVGFFAPKAAYASTGKYSMQVDELKNLIKRLHAEGIEVILDVVFNHTAEGNENGPYISYRGIDNKTYYMLTQDGYYFNFSGCGNTLNCNHPVVRDFIIDCLRYWVCEMHVDGFRFDLGSILGRDSTGQLMEDPPVLERIAEDPILRNTKIIAEAWDAGGAYQVGSFPGGRWAEWNDRFRDDIRKFWRGDDGLSNALATRLAGSSDLYLRDGRKPFHSVNFLTSHDGFTLNDLVSYNGKHNEENGENNRDGSDNNNSYNYGYEGPSMNPAIETLRTRQAKNLIFTLLLAQGTPMLLAGDEFRRTQGGNNNAYCQDNISSWVDWSLRNKYSELFRFTKKLILFRRKHHAFMRPEFFQGKDISFNSLPDITWFDESGLTPDWGRLNHFLAYRLDGSHAEIFADTDDNDFFIMFNSALQDKTVKIPLPPIGKKWYRCIDTSIEAPEDFMSPGEEEILPVQNRYVLPARSCALLMSKL